MWKKSKLVLLSSALALSVTCSAPSVGVLAADNLGTQVNQPITQNYVKIKFENKVLFHELVPTKTIIQVLNTNGEVIESEVLSGDKEMELGAPKISKGKMLSYWAIEKDNNKMTVEPVLIDARGLNVTFSATEGGELLENNAQTKVITRSVTKGTKLQDILPEVNPKDHHKFIGWFQTLDGKEEKVKDMEGLKVSNVGDKYYAKFYPDFNENDIDDRTEAITVKFVTNSDQKFKDIQTYVGRQINLPVLKKKDAVFMGWYTDEELKKKATGDPLTGPQTFYAKWEKAEKVMKEAETKPVTDQAVSNQIESILNDRLKGMNTNTSAVQVPSTIPTVPNMPISNSGNSVSDQTDNTGTATQSNVFKDTQYVFDNKNLGQQYMVKFFDENEDFLFSLTLPYGKTIKTYDQDGQFHNEYAVRQDTTITLNTHEYIREGSILQGFDTREVRVNSAKITEIYPEVKSDVKAANAAYIEKAMEEQTQADKKKAAIIIGLVAAAIAIIAGVSLYLYKKRRKQVQGLDPI